MRRYGRYSRLYESLIENDNGFFLEESLLDLDKLSVIIDKVEKNYNDFLILSFFDISEEKKEIEKQIKKNR